MDYAPRIVELLNSFTEEYQKFIFAKCKELGFDTNRGDVTLEEAFINLNQSKDIILDAINKDHFRQIPISIQKAIAVTLDRIGNFQTSIVSSGDEVVNLVNAIENLFMTLWQNGFHNLSEEFLGYTSKMNQLKELELQMSRLKTEMEQGAALNQSIQGILAQSTESDKQISFIKHKSDSTLALIVDNSNDSLSALQKTAAHLATVEQNDTSVAQFLATSKLSSAEIAALETRIKDFNSSIETVKVEVDTVKTLANDTVTDNDTKTKQLQSDLQELENQIKDKITKATGYTLFHSFQTRQEQIHKSKYGWLVAIVIILITSVVITLSITYKAGELKDTAFYIKLSAGLPLLFALIFCSTQYTRERRLEEEYAFKSNISISLEPYKDLVEKLVGLEQSEKAKFNTFIIESISKVFTSPTRRIFDKGKDEIKPEEMLKNTSEFIKPFLDVLKK